MSRLEIFLAVLVVIALGWLGTGMFRGKHADMCTPLPLSQEVKAYIDSKVAASGTSQCSEIPKLVAKLSDLQVKMGGIELYRLNRAQKEAKHGEYLENGVVLRKKWTEVLNGQRFAEVGRIKAEIAGMCSGSGGGSGGGGGKLGPRGRMQQGGGQKATPVGIPGPEDDAKDKAGAPSDGL